MGMRLMRVLQTAVAMLSLAMLVGPAGPASAQESDAKASCKQGGWETLITTEGEGFDNQGACVSYVAADGGVPVSPPAILLELSEIRLDGTCKWHIEVLNLDSTKIYSYDVYVDGEYVDRWQIPYYPSLSTYLPLAPGSTQVELYLGTGPRTFVAQTESLTCPAEG